ncbi:hypothetical protein PV377_03105 [Streptomyces ipomoeae]|uniref:hypothetical protein n=1 Tax=Streptomyces ipomoeae TaxID=103232 RepID=UPI0029B954A6|nr:hypothetical protein [Streptomyces ipomoeae]MDX2838001.1 hypothetical protein [Streptomyces ipomoeae]
MARLQILELPKGTGDDRPPFVLVADQMPSTDDAFKALCGSLGVATAEQIGARTVLVFEATVDIPANDIPVDADGNPLFRAQVEEQIEHALSNVTRAANGGRHLAQERTEITRDMHRLAKWKNELTHALGMDRTRDWDDIRNAAAGLRKERDVQAAELERLRTGEEPVTDQRITLTPGQWIWQWNRATPEKRLDMAAQILDGMTRSNNCFMADHETQIERLRAEVVRLSSEPATGTPDA